MGFGGILAALAGGIGTGMVKISEEAWREAEKQKYYDFQHHQQEQEQKWKSEESKLHREHESQLQRDRHAHDFQLQQQRHAHDFRLANHRSALSRAEARTKEPNSDKKTFMEHYNSAITLSKSIAEIDQHYGELGEIPDNVKAHRQQLVEELNNINSSEEFWKSAQAGGREAQALFYSVGGKRPTIQETTSISNQSTPAKTVSQILRNPTTADSYTLRNALKQRQEEEARERRYKAQEESKKYAAEQKHKMGYWGYAP